MDKKRIVASLLTIGATAALLVGGTFAYFSSQATSTDNVFGAGTLVLQLDDSGEGPASTITASFGGSDIAPGATVSGYISMHNAGTIGMAEVNLSATETTPSTPDLAGKLNITSAKIGTDTICATDTVDITSSFTTLAALNSAGLDLPSSDIAAGATKYLCMSFRLDPLTEDAYQGLSITETFTFVGHQDLSQ